MKWFVLIFITVFGFLKSQNITSTKVEEIKKYIKQIQNDKNLTKKKFSLVNQNRTKIDYNYELRSGEIVKIERTWNEERKHYIDSYTDEFILQNEKPVFVYQSIYYENPKDKNDSGGWNVRCWIENFKVLEMTSKGHGKTELDNWNYEKEFRENFDYMLKMVRKNEKKFSDKK